MLLDNGRTIYRKCRSDSLEPAFVTRWTEVYGMTENKRRKEEKERITGSKGVSRRGNKLIP